MIFLWSQPSTDHLEELMQTASAMTGFSLDDIEALVNSELETPHLLEYVTAVMTNRVN